MVMASAARDHRSDLPSDLWRRSVKNKSASRCSTTAPDGAKWCTKIVSLQASPFLLVSSGAKTKNLFILEHVAPSKFDEDAAQEACINVLSTLSVPHSVYSMHVHKSTLALAGPDGTAQLFEITPADLATKGIGLAHIAAITITTAVSLEAVPVSAPGQWARSVRLNSIHICPLDANKIVATQGRRIGIHHVDIGETDSHDVATDLLTSALYSPHVPHVLACAGADRNIYVLDTRIDCRNHVAWHVSNAHRYAITDLQFSPFIPYWLASASGDGAVKVWDLRYGKEPAARIDGHYQSVNALAWSTTRIDLVGTVSSDKSWRAWSFNSSLVVPRHPGSDACIACPGSEWNGTSRKKASVGDVAVGATQIAQSHTGYRAPVVSLAASSFYPDTFYCVSSVGDVQSHCILSETFEDKGPSFFDSKRHPAESEFERALKARNLAAAFSLAATLTKSNPKADAILNLCNSRPPIPQSEYTIDGSNEGGPQLIQDFRKTLDEYCTGLPPGFDQQPWLALLPARVKAELDRVTFRLNLSNDVANGNWAGILKNEKSLIHTLSTDVNYLDMDVITAIIECVFPHEPVKAMNLTLKLAEIAEDAGSNKFLDYVDLLWMCLFPTVYDSEKFLPPLDVTNWDSVTSLKWKMSKDARKTRRRDIEGTLRDSRVVLAMLRVEINLQKVLSRPNVEEEVLRVIAGDRALNGSLGAQAASKERERTISARANRMYLDALLKCGRHEEWFGVCAELISTFQATDFARQLMSLADKPAMRHLRTHVDILFKEASTHLVVAVQTSQLNTRQVEVSAKFSAAIQILGKTFILVSKISSIVLAMMPQLYSHDKVVHQDKEALDKVVMDAINGLSVQLKDLLNMLGESLDKILETAKRIVGPVGSTTYTTLWASVNVLIKDMEAIARTFRRGDKGPTGQLVIQVASVITQLKEWVKETGGSWS
ncbi:hypothetical protein SeMB42_g04433 [Synchytrium endobioticum]|uniref:Uncharacterized protein n=1 Tax=Synchytrium endobioticum TaxID=286115 RepID=A0A507CWY8_9FUNG|nr:hypothetical protein SeLEV6574_g04882 [Synchytrium endobioticum]TPX44104.1 hypothetical protein SeMB42_g04433 [Synchytrium endobioticum]